MPTVQRRVKVVGHVLLVVAQSHLNPPRVVFVAKRQPILPHCARGVSHSAIDRDTRVRRTIQDQQRVLVIGHSSIRFRSDQTVRTRCVVRLVAGSHCAGRRLLSAAGPTNRTLRRHGNNCERQQTEATAPRQTPNPHRSHGLTPGVESGTTLTSRMLWPSSESRSKSPVKQARTGQTPRVQGRVPLVAVVRA
ncbi:MAG: hypothetical protein FD138_377 [Planctomycetota bacterium]|nr:MAG: hypothetical protein FD138_377 [Planctomycetota bacterium]